MRWGRIVQAAAETAFVLAMAIGILLFGGLTVPASPAPFPGTCPAGSHSSLSIVGQLCVGPVWPSYLNSDV